MQAIALRPQRGQIIGMLTGIVVLTLCMALLPALCLPLGFLLPIFACPLIGTKKQWAGIAAVILPPAIALLRGLPTLFSLSLLFACGAPVLTAILLHPKKASSPMSYFFYLAAYLFGVIIVLIGLQSTLKGDLAAGLAQQITNSVGEASSGGTALYQLAASGFISLPSGAASRGLLSFLVDQTVVRQSLMSLRLSLETLLNQLLPTWIVQVCLLGSVFTTLRVQRLHHSYLLVDQVHKEQVKLAVIPGFSALQLPKGAGAMMAVTFMGAIIFSGVSGSWAQQLSLLMLAVFLNVYELLGAAVLIGLLSRRNPDGKILYGCIAAALYVIFPTALFFLGVLDPLFHFRTMKQNESKEDDDL
ncbi:MAG: hypothetical protein PHI98_05505 [Eubacteriales bacterium]|nr:hypothetical protein [Eubacteriales bacterium]